MQRPWGGNQFNMMEESPESQFGWRALRIGYLKEVSKRCADSGWAVLGLPHIHKIFFCSIMASLSLHPVSPRDSRSLTLGMCGLGFLPSWSTRLGSHPIFCILKSSFPLSSFPPDHVHLGTTNSTTYQP